MIEVRDGSIYFLSYSEEYFTENINQEKYSQYYKTTIRFANWRNHRCITIKWNMSWMIEFKDILQAFIIFEIYDPDPIK